MQNAYNANESGGVGMKKLRYRPWPPQPARPTRRQDPGDGLWCTVGCVLISAGLLLLFLCIPGWAWAALSGAALVCAGWGLIATCRR